MSMTVIGQRCPQNHACPSVRACPHGALTQSGFRAPEIDPTKCTLCGKCVRVCPMGAFTPDRK